MVNNTISKQSEVQLNKRCKVIERWLQVLAAGYQQKPCIATINYILYYLDQLDADYKDNGLCSNEVNMARLIAFWQWRKAQHYLT